MFASTLSVQTVFFEGERWTQKPPVAITGEFVADKSCIVTDAFWCGQDYERGFQNIFSGFVCVHWHNSSVGDIANLKKLLAAFDDLP